MKIGILGCGVVGSEVIRILDHLQATKNSNIQVKRILDRKAICDSRLTNHYEDILHDPEIDTIVEVMGGLHPAYEYITAALKAKKNVVSANKAVSAAYFKEFNELANENNVHFKIEASVGGGIPWIKEIQRILRIDEISSFRGIMNGTTNYILDEMFRDEVDFVDALKEAQKKGYAESDPSADIEGYDIRNKSAITASIAYKSYLDINEIPTIGISNIKKEDILYFKSKGYICKLLATSNNYQDYISLYVCPTLTRSIEGQVHTNLNITSYTSNYLGTLQIIGQGAGGSPTASAVVSDLFDIDQNNYQPFTLEKQLVIQNNEVHHFYVRQHLEDFQEDIALSYEKDKCYVYIQTKKMTLTEILEQTQGKECFIAMIQENTYENC